MKLAVCVLVPSALFALLLTGCEAPANVPRAASHRSAVPQANWTERREAQLIQMGLKSSDARSKAREEANSLGYAGDTYTVYNSQAKQQAEQEKFESDFAKANSNR